MPTATADDATLPQDAPAAQQVSALAEATDIKTETAGTALATAAAPVAQKQSGATCIAPAAPAAAAAPAVAAAVAAAPVGIVSPGAVQSATAKPSLPGCTGQLVSTAPPRLEAVKAMLQSTAVNNAASATATPMTTPPSAAAFFANAAVLRDLAHKLQGTPVASAAVAAADGNTADSTAGRYPARPTKQSVLLRDYNTIVPPCPTRTRHALPAAAAVTHTLPGLTTVDPAAVAAAAVALSPTARPATPATAAVGGASGPTTSPIGQCLLPPHDRAQQGSGAAAGGQHVSQLEAQVTQLQQQLRQKRQTHRDQIKQLQQQLQERSSQVDQLTQQLHEAKERQHSQLKLVQAQKEQTQQQLGDRIKALEQQLQNALQQVAGERAATQHAQQQQEQAQAQTQLRAAEVELGLLRAQLASECAAKECLLTQIKAHLSAQHAPAPAPAVPPTTPGPQ